MTAPLPRSSVEPSGTPYMAPAKASDWRTPMDLIDRIRSFAPVVLDPCASPDPVHHFARVNLTGPDLAAAGSDGLSEPWVGHGGLAYCNPPYSELRAWCEWAAVQAAFLPQFRADEILLLIPARTDTNAWHESIVGVAAAVCFVRGRLRFQGAPGGAPFPVALVYYGSRAERFRQHFDPLGWVVTA